MQKSNIVWYLETIRQHKWTTGLSILGTLFVLQKSLRFARMWSSNFGKLRNLNHHYGKNSWAIISGSSGGLGAAYATILARQGFNIVLMGTNTQKLKDLSDSITHSHNVKTQNIAFDFTSMSTSNFEEKFSLIKELDVSILINNVGISYPSNFHELSYSQVQSFIETNITSSLNLTHTVLPLMLQRKKRCGIIFVSSIMRNGYPFYSMYSATKAFIHSFGISLSKEYFNQNIDFLVVSPGDILTKMNPQKSYFSILPNVAAQNHLRALVNSKESNGHILHYFQSKILQTKFGQLYQFNKTQKILQKRKLMQVPSHLFIFLGT